MKTRKGIFYDLSHSDYKVHLEDTNMTFVFSSKLYLMKFKEQYKEHRKEFNLKLKTRYKIGVNFITYADLVLYRQIETRGFLIIGEGGNKLCQTNLLLDGERMIQNPSQTQ
jgi:hypothetical protein